VYNPPVPIQIERGEEAVPGVDVGALREKLHAHGVGATGHTDGRLFVHAARDGDDILGAAAGHTWGGTCELAVLFVEPPQRGQGTGSALVRDVIALARERDCKQVLLATHSYQAPGFYEKLGFRLLFSIDDYPAGHAQLFYRLPL
jgi:GNAT superfamily N-acetyltransferase